MAFQALRRLEHADREPQPFREVCRPLYPYQVGIREVSTRAHRPAPRRPTRFWW
jgi:hypothetical protein